MNDEETDNDDPSRPRPENEWPLFGRKLIFVAISPPLDLILDAWPELLILVVLLAITLMLSALRAAYAVTSIPEPFWERKNAALDTSQKLTLSLLQRTTLLVAFLLAAHLAWKAALNPEFAPYVWLAFVVLALWLWLDALVRFYAGHHAAAFTQKVHGLVRPVMKFLMPVNTFLARLGEAWGILLPDEGHGNSENLESEAETEEERDLLRGLATFGQTTARQASQPRLNITAVDVELDFHELMDKINKSGYSRIPAYDDTLDSVEGILYVKDLLPHLHRDEHFAWQKLLRKAYFIPESKRLDDLMHEFQNRRVHMAIVVDEYGGTDGLITLEDIIEEIFGDINDEYDEAEEIKYTQVDERTYIFEGRVLLNDFCKILGLEPDYFEEVRRASESLGGLLLELFSQLPRTGEEVSYENLTFKIQSADKKRIKKVRVLVA
ncbi:transporter associated domain-containing protein [Persicitalea sp.]|uniref:transporter associated domain-containing protein n=1 Tax=Persicitalea sp. TaxID=3100273 RepID=UPI0035934618